MGDDQQRRFSDPLIDNKLDTDSFDLELDILVEDETVLTNTTFTLAGPKGGDPKLRGLLLEQKHPIAFEFPSTKIARSKEVRSPLFDCRSRS